jgi:hypothetical protein
MLSGITGSLVFCEPASVQHHDDQLRSLADIDGLRNFLQVIDLAPAQGIDHQLAIVLENSQIHDLLPFLCLGLCFFVVDRSRAFPSRSTASSLTMNLHQAGATLTEASVILGQTAPAGAGPGGRPSAAGFGRSRSNSALWSSGVAPRVRRSDRKACRSGYRARRPSLSASPGGQGLA